MPCEGFMSFGPYFRIYDVKKAYKLEKLSLTERSNSNIFASSHIQTNILPPEVEFHVLLTNIYQCMPRNFFTWVSSSVQFAAFRLY